MNQLIEKLTARGAVVNVSSASAMDGTGSSPAYSASKAALIGFTKSVAREVASRGITVNALAPMMKNNSAFPAAAASRGCATC
jgi:3-oxoacyl-[acyl-carrier protein] reductase